jgi:hypothetical protein
MAKVYVSTAAKATADGLLDGLRDSGMTLTANDDGSYSADAYMAAVRQTLDGIDPDWRDKLSIST